MFDLWSFIVDALDSLMYLLWPKHAYRSLRPPKRKHDVKDSRMDDFLRDMKRAFEGHLSGPSLLAMSAKLHEQFLPKLQSSDICMLPSYIHTLPSGKERGTYLALDVGGSTLRVAAVQLHGRGNGAQKSMEILKMKSFRIDNLVKALKGHAFFEWMAENIANVLEEPIVKRAHGEKKVAMGLAWSFPVEYV
jgi:hexokinase